MLLGKKKSVKVATFGSETKCEKSWIAQVCMSNRSCNGCPANCSVVKL